MTAASLKTRLIALEQVRQPVDSNLPSEIWLTDPEGTAQELIWSRTNPEAKPCD